MQIPEYIIQQLLMKCIVKVRGFDKKINGAMVVPTL